MRVVHTVRGVGFRIGNDILDAAERQTMPGVPSSIRENIGQSSQLPDEPDGRDATNGYDEHANGFVPTATV